MRQTIAFSVLFLVCTTAVVAQDTSTVMAPPHTIVTQGRGPVMTNTPKPDGDGNLYVLLSERMENTSIVELRPDGSVVATFNPPANANFRDFAPIEGGGLFVTAVRRGEGPLLLRYNAQGTLDAENRVPRGVIPTQLAAFGPDELLMVSLDASTGRQNAMLITNGRGEKLRDVKIPEGEDAGMHASARMATVGPDGNANVIFDGDTADIYVIAPDGQLKTHARPSKPDFKDAAARLMGAQVGPGQVLLLWSRTRNSAAQGRPAPIQFLFQVVDIASGSTVSLTSPKAATFGLAGFDGMNGIFLVPKGTGFDVRKVPVR